MTTETALTLPQRAALALESSKTEVRLRELVASTADMVEVLNKAARDQIHSAAMTYRDHRVTIEKTGKASRDDATKFSKAVIAEEARLIDIITPEEKRLLALRDAYDAKIEAEKQAKLAVERARVEAQQGLIDAFGKLVMQSAGKGSAEAKELLAMLVKLEPSTPTFDEDFIDRARTAWDSAYESLDMAYSAAYDAEQAIEAARLKREEEDRQRAAEAAENARQKAELDRVAAEQAAERKRLDDAAEAQRVELARVQKEADDKIKAQAAAETARIQAEADLRAALAKQEEDLDRYKAAHDAVSGKLSAVWKGIEEAVEKFSGEPCKGEPFDRLDELLSALAQRAGSGEANPVAVPVMEKYPHGWGGVDDNCEKWLANQPNGTRLYTAPPPQPDRGTGFRRLSVKVTDNDPNGIAPWGQDTVEKYSVELVPDPQGILCIWPGPGEQDSGRDAARLDFMIANDAFVQPTLRDGTIKQYQLMNQDEDEDFHYLSGPEDCFFNSPREAIDAAMAAQQGDKGGDHG